MLREKMDLSSQASESMFLFYRKFLLTHCLTQRPPFVFADLDDARFALDGTATGTPTARLASARAVLELALQADKRRMLRANSMSELVLVSAPMLLNLVLCFHDV